MQDARMSFEHPMRYSAARAAGASGWEVRFQPWEHPHQGVVALAGSDGEDRTVRINEAIPLVRHGTVITGWAAAYRHGVTMLDGRDRFFGTQPITFATPRRGQHRNREGIAATRRSIHRNEIVELDGIDYATITRAAYDAGLDAPGVCEALVVIEMCVSTVIHQSRTSIANIERLVESHKKTRGIVKVRRALSMATSRSASPWETRTRYVAERIAGIEGLKANVPIFDSAGHLIAIVDLLDVESGLVIESDGAGHRRADLHSSDNIREERVERAGLVVSRVSAIDHQDREALATRLAQARLHARLARATQAWTVEKPAWWWEWPIGRQWD